MSRASAGSYDRPLALPSQGRVVARRARDIRRDLGEIIGEAGQQATGSPHWWGLATAALAAWALYVDDEEYGLPSEYRHRAARGLRERLACQWRAFTEAAIRDQSYPAASPRLPTCQLRLARPATPRLAHPAFSPLACTCQACTDRLGRTMSRNSPLTSGQRPSARASWALSMDERPLTVRSPAAE